MKSYKANQYKLLSTSSIIKQLVKLNTYIDFLDVLVLQVLKWLKKILFNVVLHRIFNLSQLFIGLSSLHQSSTCVYKIYMQI